MRSQIKRDWSRRAGGRMPELIPFLRFIGSGDGKAGRRNATGRPFYENSDRWGISDPRFGATVHRGREMKDFRPENPGASGMNGRTMTSLGRIHRPAIFFRCLCFGGVKKDAERRSLPIVVPSRAREPWRPRRSRVSREGAKIAESGIDPPSGMEYRTSVNRRADGMSVGK